MCDPTPGVSAGEEIPDWIAAEIENSRQLLREFPASAERSKFHANVWLADDRARLVEALAQKEQELTAEQWQCRRLSDILATTNGDYFKLKEELAKVSVAYAALQSEAVRQEKDIQNLEALLDDAAVAIRQALYNEDGLDDEEVLRRIHERRRSGERRVRHYRGGEYVVIADAVHSETEEPLVVYRGASGVWVRPASMFYDTVTLNGEDQPRFAPIPE